MSKFYCGEKMKEETPKNVNSKALKAGGKRGSGEAIIPQGKFYSCTIWNPNWHMHSLFLHLFFLTRKQMVRLFHTKMVKKKAF